MTDSHEPSTKLRQGSLWTTPVAVGSGPLNEAKVDPTVSAEKIRQALADVKERTNAFAGRVSEEVLRTSFNR